MKKLALLSMLLISEFGFSLDLNLSLDHGKVLPGAVRPMWSLNEEIEFTDYVGLNWDVYSSIHHIPVYWENKVYFYGGDSKVKEIGWEFETGFSIKKVDVFWKHHSQHWADVRSQNGARFPVTDVYGLKFNFRKER